MNTIDGLIYGTGVAGIISSILAVLTTSEPLAYMALTLALCMWVLIFVSIWQDRG